MLPIAMVTGFGGGSSAVLSNSMKADVIDLDTLKTGQNRAALFFAIWATTQKLALSFGPALALYAIVLLGYDDSAGAVHTENSLWGVKIVFALGPPIFMLLTAWVAWRYPITEVRHRKMREAIERRNARRTERERVAAAEEWSTASPARAPRRLDPGPARG
jgi:Na+/melibiose symporter-like transporter